MPIIFGVGTLAGELLLTSGAVSLEMQKDEKIGLLVLLGLLKAFALGGTRCYEKGAEIDSLACWQKVYIKIIVRKPNQENISENVIIAERKRNKDERNDCAGEMCSPREQ